MIKRSTEMGVALYARGFEASTKMTEYKETKGITSLDVTVVAILTAFLIYVVVLGHTVTSIFVR
jgi:energy-coupling factor transporter transmembrane protein EcfT